MSDKQRVLDAFKGVGEARAIVDKANAEQRDLSDEESKIVEEKMSAARREAAHADLSTELDSLAKLATPDRPAVKSTEEPETKSKVAGSLGKQFVESAQYKGLRDRGLQGGSWSTGAIPMEYKTLLDTSSGSGGTLIQPDVSPGILPLLFQRLTVADLMPSGNTDSNTVRYLKETTATNAADTVAEGAAKPESAFVFDDIDESVRKIATFLPVTDEMLEDYSQIMSYLDGRLRLFIQITEEDQLLNGSITPPDIVGILNRTNVQSQAKGTDTDVDAIFKAMTKVRNQFVEPDGLVINPADWQDVRLLKDANDQYYGGGPFGPQYGENLWGMRVVVTTAIAAGTALVGAFRTAAQIFRKSGITVEASNGYSDYFVKNKTAIRAEERLALAVYRPAAFCTVTGI